MSEEKKERRLDEESKRMIDECLQLDNSQKTQIKEIFYDVAVGFKENRPVFGDAITKELDFHFPK